MPIRIALIGSGIHAKEMLLPAILACSNIELKTIYSRTLKSAQALSAGLPDINLVSEDGGEQPNAGIQSLYTSDEIDAVVIALPILVQVNIIQEFFKHGKHVLSEKPIAPTVDEARQLRTSLSLDGSDKHNNKTVPTWSVAENFRCLDSFIYASEQIKKMGRVLGFRTNISKMTKAGERYYETAWRKNLEYQGGFLLDGGVHFIAATRLLLGPENAPVKVSAFTSQLQKHLPPVDTVNAVWQLKSGVSGTFSVSFGTTFNGTDYAIACEKGIVLVDRGVVTIVDKTGEPKTTRKEFPDEGSGVQQEIDAWAEGLLKSEVDEKLSPEEALGDLLVLEAMLNSGTNGGNPVDISW